MKRLLHIILAAAVLLPAVHSCTGMGSDVIYDIAPIVLRVYLVDSDGTDLLDPANAGNGIDVSGITAEFQGKTYVLSDKEQGVREVGTKAYMPYFSGLNLESDPYGRWMLSFGELDGEENFDNEDFTINWGDGTSTVITIFNKFKWKTSGSPSITRRFYVDGKKQDSDIATFKLVK